MKRRAFTWLLLLLPVAVASASPRSSSVLSGGLTAFRQAAEAKDGTTAEALYRKALTDFRFLIEQDGIRNEAIFYDLGNTYERLGDLGRAILSYRRAALYDSFDPQLEHNLAYARQKRKDTLPVARPPLVLRVFFFWHYDLSVGVQVLLFALAFGLLFLVLATRLLVKRRWLNWVAVGSGALAVLLVASLAWSQIRLATHHEGVIVASEVTARQGDALSYDPAFKDPLHSGTEFTLLSARPEWYHIALSDGTDAWIPQSSAELVRPAAR